jgi:hypothetical protein
MKQNSHLGVEIRPRLILPSFYQPSLRRQIFANVTKSRYLVAHKPAGISSPHPQLNPTDTL